MTTTGRNKENGCFHVLYGRVLYRFRSGCRHFRAIRAVYLVKEEKKNVYYNVVAITIRYSIRACKNE